MNHFARESSGNRLWKLKKAQLERPGEGHACPQLVLSGLMVMTEPSYSC